MYVRDMMITEPATCSPQTTLHDVAMMMWNCDCGAIPVVDEQRHPLGIVTDRDIAMGAALQHRPLWEIRAEDITSNRELICCEPESSIEDALQTMEQHQIRRLPVTNEQRQLCGMLSMGDIVAFTTPAAARAGGQIGASQTIAYLKQVSAHHPPRMAA